jgi:hypothetical protein
MVKSRQRLFSKKEAKPFADWLKLFRIARALAAEVFWFFIIGKNILLFHSESTL